jgi:dolichol-phosphate mannosyltransferase
MIHDGEMTLGRTDISGGPELSIIVPTYNERDNVGVLVDRLAHSLEGLPWEVIFVDDDSKDGTADAVRELSAADVRVRCVQRIGRRGLSSACIEGMLASSAPLLAVMDADLQHDETLLPRMFEVLKREPQVDLVVGSRYVEGGSVGDWNRSRVGISRFATRVSHLVVPAELTDPMSGFFMLRRTTLALAVRRLSAIGFKILMDLFASSTRKLVFKELPYRFGQRLHGESKLDSVVAWDYGMLLLDKLVGHILPVRFIGFALVGGMGVFVHFVVLLIAFKALHVDFVKSQALATLLAMTFNFSVNNVLTYRDVRLRGWRWLRGWLSFVAVCSLGAFANVGVASYLYKGENGWIPAAIAGIMVGVVWNYVATTALTWGRSSR